MIKEFIRLVAENRQIAETLFRRCLALEEPVLLRSQIQVVADAYCGDFDHDCPEEFRKLVDVVQEALTTDTDLYLALRARVAHWQYVHIHVDSGQLREIKAQEYLSFKESLANGGHAEYEPLEIDLSPFERGFPKMKEMRSIGRGVEFLNRYLSGRLFDRRGGGMSCSSASSSCTRLGASSSCSPTYSRTSPHCARL